MKVFLFAAMLMGTVFARCPNDCNGKGICNSASVCECYSNYMGNDCSKRLCNFGKAWIDTNLGDLNANGIIDTDQQIFAGVANGLVGEKYDPNYAVARENNVDEWDEAHFYRECSNKGICNRKTGLCDCFPGFEGEGCRRMSCPLDCNGHGKCMLIEDEKTAGEYTLWDQDKIQACKCDPGYTGPDCSSRECAKGVDPVEFTYSNVDAVYKIEFHAMGKQDWKDGTLPNGPTYFTITYTDDFGDDWTTHAITMYYQANCPTADNTAADQFWNPETLSTSECDSTPFIANPRIPQTNTDPEKFGWVRNSDFLDTFYNSGFLFDASFVGEQVNNTLKNLPNDLVRAPYVWTVYNPVDLDTDNLTPTADKGFLYPTWEVPNFNLALNVGGNPGSRIDNWWKCHSETNADSYCSGYNFNGPSVGTDDPKYRFPMFHLGASLDVVASGQVHDAASKYLNCALHSVCIFIRIPGAKGSKEMSINYHYKPASYILKSTGTAVSGTDAVVADYDVVYGSEVRGTHATGTFTSNTNTKVLTLSDVGTARVWDRAHDGDPAITYDRVLQDTDIHSCSRRGLCDYDTGKCECFFGYVGHKCSTRTPSNIQGL